MLSCGVRRPAINLPEAVANRGNANPGNQRVGDKDDAPRLVSDESGRGMQDRPNRIGRVDGIEQIVGCDHHDAESRHDRSRQVNQSRERNHSPAQRP